MRDGAPRPLQLAGYARHSGELLGLDDQLGIFRDTRPV